MYLKKIALAVLAFFVLSFVSGYVIWYNDLTKHESDLQTYIRLAVKDAIVNIQTTEEQGLNFKTAYGSIQASEKYSEYITALSNSSNNDKNVEETLSTIQRFLDNNKKALDSGKATSDGLFRPIQFGMTYVDKDLFAASFKKSLMNLIEVNYNSNHNLSTSFSCYDALHVYEDKISVTVDGPKVVPLSDSSDATSEFLRQLYGISGAEDYINEYNNSLSSDSAALGISTSTVPNFYVYYDIQVSVPWGSSTAFPFLSQYVWDNKGFGNIEFSDQNPYAPDAQRFIRWHSDSTEEIYRYRYVLLN